MPQVGKKKFPYTEKGKKSARKEAAESALKKRRPAQKWSAYRGDGPPLPLLSDEIQYGLYTKPEERVRGATTSDWRYARAKARFEETGNKPGEGLSMKEKEKFIKARKKK